jgi:hypothetical protein
MKKLLILSMAILVMAVGGNAMASVVPGPTVDGLRTFQDTNTGRYWLDLNNFFDENATQMVATATAAGFKFAVLSDVQQLLNSLPLTGGQWPTYNAIMGGAPYRALIWGAYDQPGSSLVGWAWAYSGDASWSIEANNWDYFTIPNAGTDLTDCDIWAYRTVIPLPSTILLLGSGLMGLAGLRRFRKH